jgi:DNA-binding MarR family transcriptional regulator
MDTEVIGDLASLQALTHPLRLRLLGVLRTDGPATASELGRSLGESSGATSYHLRQLERFGFVEDHPDPTDQRTRRWRATSDSSQLRRELLREEPAAAEAVDRLVGLQVAPVVAALSAAARAPEDGWLDAVTSTDHRARYTPAQLKALLSDLLEVLDRHRAAARTDAAGDPDARPIVLYLGAAPVQDE